MGVVEIAVSVALLILINYQSYQISVLSGQVKDLLSDVEELKHVLKDGGNNELKK